MTIPLADLMQQLRGAGLTSTGQVLFPATVRRLACDAQLLPMVLGGHSELLDLGPASATSPPRNDAPSPAATGTAPTPAAPDPPHGATSTTCGGAAGAGPTDLDNAALLCERHHTLVHRQDLHGTVNQHGVTWHRRPPPDSDDATSETPPEPG